MSAPTLNAGYRVRETCRGCGARGLESVLEYGDVPLAGAFVRPEEADDQDRFPLTLAACRRCGLAQVPQVIDADVMFRDYRYRASIPLRRHFEGYADSVPARLGLRPDGLIVEAGCNDGVLLRPLLERGFTNLLGVDPADNITSSVPAEIPVLSGYFEPELAARVAQTHGRAQLVAANNVFAHMDEPHGFAAAAARLLEPDGVFAFEVHYLLDLLDGFQYDTVYHEHVLYYSLTALRPLLARHGLRLFDVERISNHGGSIRAFACLESSGRAGTAELSSLLAEEDRRGVASGSAFGDFAAGVRSRIGRLGALIEAHAAAGDRIAAYGAAGRAAILFTAVPQLEDHVAYVVDESPERIGRVMPGTHVPIVAPDRLEQDPPDLVLLSAWSYADVLAAKVADRAPRAQCCVPLPEPGIV